MLCNFDVDLSSYEIIGEISQGTFGNVYKIKNKKDSKNYAAKESKYIVTQDKKELNDLMREIQNNARICHPLFVKFEGFSPTNFQVESVMFVQLKIQNKIGKSHFFTSRLAKTRTFKKLFS